MSGRFTNGYFALGLVIGLIAATIFYVSVTSIEPYSGQQAQAEERQSSSEPAYQEDDEGYWRWSGFVSTEDTLAQWIMALLSIVAVVLSGLAVLFVWKTLIATRDMARDTQRIGEAQTTSYVVIDRAQIRPSPIAITVLFSARNVGASPAHQVRAEIVVSPYNVSYPKGLRPFSEPRKAILADMEPSGVRDSAGGPTSFTDSSFFAKVDLSAHEFYAVITVTWVDVFGWERTGVFHMTSRQSAEERDLPDRFTVMTPGKTEFTRKKAS